jgi:hypothetical protein
MEETLTSDDGSTITTKVIKRLVEDDKYEVDTFI